MTLPETSVGLDYQAGLDRCDLEVFLNTTKLTPNVILFEGVHHYRIPGVEISEPGTLHFRTPDGDTIATAAILERAATGA